jgi:hypothetical protein
MSTKTNENENKLVQNFIDEYSKVYPNNVDKLKTRIVGNNGFELGQTFTLTGALKIVKNVNDKGDTTAVYLALETKEGTDISLQSFMNISSLNGYALKDTPIFEDYATKQVTPKNINDIEKLTKEHKTLLVEDFDFADVYQPTTRNLIEFATQIQQGKVNLEDKKLTYLGIAYKQITAKKCGESFGEYYGIGYRRCISTKLWKLE